MASATGKGKGKRPGGPHDECTARWTRASSRDESLPRTEWSNLGRDMTDNPTYYRRESQDLRSGVAAEVGASRPTAPSRRLRAAAPAVWGVRSGRLSGGGRVHIWRAVPAAGPAVCGTVYGPFPQNGRSWMPTRKRTHRMHRQSRARALAPIAALGTSRPYAPGGAVGGATVIQPPGHSRV
jgi:hypothetical protein